MASVARRLRWGMLGSGMVGSGQAWRLWFVAKVAVGGFWRGWARLVSAVKAKCGLFSYVRLGLARQGQARRLWTGEAW